MEAIPLVEEIIILSPLILSVPIVVVQAQIGLLLIGVFIFVVLVLEFIDLYLHLLLWLDHSSLMIFLLFNTQGSLLGMASGYWNNLDWSPYTGGTSTLALQQQPLSMEAPFKALTKQMVPRRTYKTELNMKATPATQIRSRQAMDAPQVMLMKK